MSNSFRRGFAAWLALVVAISVGAYTGLLPTSFLGIPGSNKVGHFFLIGGLAFFLDGALRRRSLVTRPFDVPLAAALVLTVAGVEEYCQRFSSRRSSSWGDFAADIAGVVFLTWASRRVAALGSAGARAC